MSLHEYEVSKVVSTCDYPFYSLLFALIRQADTNNLEKIKQAWPDKYKEFVDRYHAPGGKLGNEVEG